jgi:hypothetical protein
MRSGRWPANVWLALLFIAASSIGFAAGMLYKAERSEVSYKQYALNNANADAKRAREYEERNCRPLSPPARDKCVNEQEYAAHQAEHDDRDLEAQRTTAVWTHYLGVAGIVGTAFGLLGVALVLFTFREQRKTSRAQLRAYVGVRIIDLERKPGNKLIANLKLINSGQTPAYHVRHGGDIICTTEEEMRAALSQVKELPKHGKLGSMFTLDAHREGFITASPFDAARTFDDPTLWKVAQDEAKLYIYGEVAYEDTFGTTHKTQYCVDQQILYVQPVDLASPVSPFKSGKDRITSFHNHST